MAQGDYRGPPGQVRLELTCVDCGRRFIREVPRECSTLSRAGKLWPKCPRCVNPPPPPSSLFSDLDPLHEQGVYRDKR